LKNCKNDPQENPEEELKTNFGINQKKRIITLFGGINEQVAEGIVSSLLCLSISNDPIYMYISTFGGEVTDMLAIYDIMDFVKKSCSIYTIGVGKIMSAGVLLMSAGTKRHRTAGKNCIFMIHPMSFEPSGTMLKIGNEIQEAKRMELQCNKILRKETKITKEQMSNIYSQNRNYYFNSQMAKKYGIIDKILN